MATASRGITNTYLLVTRSPAPRPATKEMTSYTCQWITVRRSHNDCWM